MQGLAYFLALRNKTIRLRLISLVKSFLSQSVIALSFFLSRSKE